MRTPGGIPSPVRGSQTMFFKSMIVCPGPKDRGRLLEAIMSAALPGVQGVSSRTRVIPTVARQCIHVGVSCGRPYMPHETQSQLPTRLDLMAKLLYESALRHTSR